MKILYTNFHTSTSIGGHSVYISRLAAAFAPTHQICIAAPAGSSLLRLARRMDGVEAIPQAFPSRLYAIPSAARSFRNLLLNGGFDIVHVNGSADHRLAILASMFLRKKPRIVLTKHNDIAIRRVGAEIRSRLGTSHVIAVCNYVMHTLAESPYARCGLSCVFNGVDTDEFQPVPDARRLALREKYFKDAMPQKIIVGSSAGTGEYKSWLDMVRAVSLLPTDKRKRFHVALIGGVLSSKQRAEVTRLGMDAHFTYVGQLDDVRDFVASIDVGFVLSTRVETISFACREMMACGKPVIVSNYAGLPENITSGVDGWIVPPGDPQSVARVLREELLYREERIVERGAAARQRAVREFGLNAFIAGTRKVYEAVLHDGGSAATMAVQDAVQPSNIGSSNSDNFNTEK